MTLRLCPIFAPTSSALGNTLACPRHAAVEVHSVDTNRRTVLDAQIDAFADAEAEVCRPAEVGTGRSFVLFDLEVALENFLSLGITDGGVAATFLVTTDAECADGVAGFGAE